MNPLAALPLLTLLAGPAAAQGAFPQRPSVPAPPPETPRPAGPVPSLRPERDVAVTYRVLAAGAEPKEMRVAWLVGPGLTRMEPPGAPGWILVETRPARATMVLDRERAFLRLPPEMAAGMALDVPPGTEVVRAGEDRVAGQPCTLWDAGTGRRRVRFCIAADGVMLRMASASPQGGENRMEAVSVQYGPQEPSRFQVPAGYRESRAPPPLVPQGR